MRITTILPVSRLQYLDRILDSLKNQIYKPHALIVIFDGAAGDFPEVRNKVVGLGYNQVLCVPSLNTSPAIAIPQRREHIASIHNQARELIADADWIFSIEDDGVLPRDALSRLVHVAKYHDDAGMITGVELGRWGVPYVGAWRVNDVFNTTQVTSMQSHAGDDLVEEIDACGLYCALIRADLYKQHTFDSVNGLGPDVNLGLYIRQCGYTNYIDWGIPVTHLTKGMGMEIEIPATDSAQLVTLTLSPSHTWQQIKH